jgi:transcription antitermination factor NusG
MKNEKKWYVVYTKPRWEKKVYRLLQEQDVEYYCPLNKVQKKWSDRTKIVEEPLFKSYVFVRIPEAEQTKVRMTNGVINFVYWLGKPAIIKDKEIELIKMFLNEYENVKAESIELSTNMKVRIKQGAFMDREAVIKKIYNKKVQVIIESIGYCLTAVVDKSNLAISGK